MTQQRERMRRFWDARALEDPYYFINSTLDYGDPDTEEFWASGERDVATMLETLNIQVPARAELVEIGCGIGRMTRALAQRAAAVRAVDVSAEMISLARKHNDALDNVEWTLGDGTSLAGVGTASADACLSFVVLQHIPDPEVTLGYVREMGRVLRPGGWAAFQVSNEPSVHRKLSPARRAREALDALRGRRPRGRAHPAWRGSAVGLDQLDRVARDAGLERERVVGEGSQFCLILLRRRPETSSA